jgi:hypothetical protein
LALLQSKLAGYVVFEFSILSSLSASNTLSEASETVEYSSSLLLLLENSNKSKIDIIIIRPIVPTNKNSILEKIFAKTESSLPFCSC